MRGFFTGVHLKTKKPGAGGCARGGGGGVAGGVSSLTRDRLREVVEVVRVG